MTAEPRLVSREPGDPAGTLSRVHDLDAPAPTVKGNGASAGNRSQIAMEIPTLLDPETGKNVFNRQHPKHRKALDPDQPARTIMHDGNSFGNVDIDLTKAAQPGPPPDPAKPPYRVPSMDEIRALPWNGYNVASLFAGGGGSSTGYRLAGYRVLFANEFTAAARDTYSANCADYTSVDGRDVRDVSGADLLKATGLGVGELDILDGSPPCASFSTAGIREKGWGKVMKYMDTEQRSDDLFFEYIRIVRDTQPRIFVAENVSGLVKGTAKGYFQQILKAMKALGYTVSARLVNGAWMGLPQARQRLIFIGVRGDLGLSPAFPAPLPYQYSVRDALPWIDQMGTAPPYAEFVANGRSVESTMVDADIPSKTIVGGGPNLGAGFVKTRLMHDTGGLFHSGEFTDRPSPTVTVGMGSVNSYHFQVHTPTEQSAEGVPLDPETHTKIGLEPGVASSYSAQGYTRRKFTIQELRRICGFPDDYILTGSYAERWERLGQSVPPVMMEKIAITVRDQLLNPARG